MDGVILSLILLSVPGMIFQAAREITSRISMRRQRDVIRLISELVVPSILVLFLAFFCLDRFDRMGSNIVLDLVAGPEGRSETHRDVGRMAGRLAILFSVIAVLSTVFGLAWGQAVSWLSDRFNGHHPMIRMTSGLRPPIVTASVLSNTEIGAGRMVYEGALEMVQIGPEGRIDLIVLKAPLKSLMRQPVLGGNRPAQSRAMPRALQPFEPIGGEQASGDDLLFIESDDIANVFFHTAPGTKGSRLDQWMGRRFGKPAIMAELKDLRKPDETPLGLHDRTEPATNKAEQKAGSTPQPER